MSLREDTLSPTKQSSRKVALLVNQEIASPPKTKAAARYDTDGKMNGCRKVSGRTPLHHPAENTDVKARADAGFAVDSDIATLGVKDGFCQR